ncbi:thioesterase II family protein [Actinacidiphila acididurans]|uniref:Thioesterase n=1 Tax=Actinacidiphila acididurans TaxID=2784346 RepID=A0ABS2TU88_9ACTN|nr:alpha/beta fold hydrolase [Actinacidiphila acididurans]MBM9506897.1 thioesterase [Actinacidiphila acididurans]
MSVTADTAELWLRRFHQAVEAGARLVCLPHAGGSASWFFPMAKALAPEVEVVAVQYPGRQDRRLEPCRTSVGELADELVGLVAELTDKPLALFGHSLGATVAFEVARGLEARGIVPEVLFASGRRAPSIERDESVHLRDDAGIIAEIVALGGSDASLLEEPEVAAMVLPAVRGDYRAAETYRYAGGPRLSCPVVVLTGDADPKVTPREAAAWAEHTSGRFELHFFPGGHFYLSDQAPQVLDLIRGWRPGAH